jgi:DNA-binding LacI/PurR family transcriptional regulator
VHHYVKGRPYLFIDTDSEIGYRQLFDHLAGKKVTRIGLLSGGDSFINSIDRRNIVLRFVQEYGLRLISRYEGDFSQQSGFSAADFFLKGDLPDVIICTNDNMAIGLVKGLSDQNIRIPAEVKVCGFDDFELSSFVTPALTTIHNPFYEIGMRAGTLLISLIRKQETTSERLPSYLVIRDST